MMDWDLNHGLASNKHTHFLLEYSRIAKRTLPMYVSLGSVTRLHSKEIAAETVDPLICIQI